MEGPEQRLAPGRQAQVDDACALIDRPLEARCERRALAPVVGAEDADRDEIGSRGEAVDDARARRPVADYVDRLAVLGDVGSSPPSSTTTLRTSRPPTAGWSALDTGVDDRDEDAGAVASAPRPVAVEAAERRQVAELLAPLSDERLAPGREVECRSRGRRERRSPPGRLTLRRPAVRSTCSASTASRSASERDLRGIRATDPGDLLDERATAPRRRRWPSSRARARRRSRRPPAGLGLRTGEGAERRSRGAARCRAPRGWR